MTDYTINDFGQRLKQARVRAKLSLETLAQKMGGTITKQAISKYEKGLMAPSSSSLIALARALDSSIDFFFRPISPDFHNLEVSFRKKSCIGAKEIASLKAGIQDDIERFLEIESILGYDTHKPKAVDADIVLSTADDMVAQARRLRREWNLGYMPIANIQDLLESKGIKVIFSTGPDGFDGVSGVVNQDHYIMVLNKEVDTVERQRFTAVHELAHLLFNKNFDRSLSKLQHEKMCHSFANEMLIPGEVLKDAFEGKNKISFEELVYFQQLYGLSIDAIVHKLNAIGIFSDNRYRSYNIRRNTDSEFKAAVEKSRFKEIKTPRFEAMVYGALASELITESKAASLLRVPVESIHKSLTLV